MRNGAECGRIKFALPRPTHPYVSHRKKRLCPEPEPVRFWHMFCYPRETFVGTENLQAQPHNKQADPSATIPTLAANQETHNLNAYFQIFSVVLYTAACFFAREDGLTQLTHKTLDTVLPTMTGKNYRVGRVQPRKFGTIPSNFSGRIVAL
jgi:hypothetical protein